MKQIIKTVTSLFMYFY